MCGTIRSVVRQQRPVIRSDGKSVRDYFYVEDKAAAYLLLAERLAEDRNLAGHAFNFSDETPATVLEIVERILRQMDSDLEPDIRDVAPGEIPYQCLAAGKARRVLGWSPLYTLDQGLALTIPWYVEHLEREEANQSDRLSLVRLRAAHRGALAPGRRRSRML